MNTVYIVVGYIIADIVLTASVLLFLYKFKKPTFNRVVGTFKKEEEVVEEEYVPEPKPAMKEALDEVFELKNEN